MLDSIMSEEERHYEGLIQKVNELLRELEELKNEVEQENEGQRIKKIVRFFSKDRREKYVEGKERRKGKR